MILALWFNDSYVSSSQGSWSWSTMNQPVDWLLPARIRHAAALRPAIDHVQGVACWGVTNVGMWDEWLVSRDTLQGPPPKQMGGSLWNIHLGFEENLLSQKNKSSRFCQNSPQSNDVFLPFNIRIGKHLEMAWDWILKMCVPWSASNPMISRPLFLEGPFPWQAVCWTNINHGQLEIVRNFRWMISTIYIYI